MQLLDSARTIIQEQGLSSFTMESLAVEANVSKPLVYKYFDSRLGLLQELWTREYERFSSNFQQHISQVENFEDVVRIFANLNFDEASLGNIIHILGAQPDVREVTLEEEKSNSRWIARYLVKTVKDMYHLTPKQAELLVVMGSGASQAAARHYGQHGGNRKKMIEATVQFIVDGIESFEP